MAAVSFEIPFKGMALFALVAFSLFSLNDGWCTSKSDCQASHVCCHYSCVYGSSCVHRYCWSDRSCASEESCCNSYCVSESSCVGRYCSSDYGCSSGESCCRNSCVDGSSCIGRPCSSDSDCSNGESCCNRECTAGSDCLGHSCSTDSDCKHWEACCHGSCQFLYDGCDDPPPGIIAGSVVGSIVFICIICTCIFYAPRRNRTLRHARALVGQRVTATTVTTPVRTQGNPAYQGQPPPSYQQIYPYDSPPPYEQQQPPTSPPPYSPSPETSTGELPPPFTAVPQRGSGGLYAPEP